MSELTIHNLPDDFSTEEELSHPVIIRPYQSSRQSPRNKSIMYWNMIDIILSGKKTIIDVANITSLEAGELMLSAKGSYVIHQALPEKDLYKSIVFYFTNNFLSDFLIKYDKLIKEKKPSVKTPYIVYKQDAFIANYIHHFRR